MWFLTWLISLLIVSMSIVSCERSYERDYHQLREIGNFEQAEKVLALQLSMAPNDPVANLSMGEIKSELGQYSDAMVYFEKASDIAGYESDVRTSIEFFYTTEMNRGAFSFEENQMEQSIGHFENAAILKPNAHQPYFQLSYLYAMVGEVGKSADASVNCLRSNPDVVSCAFNFDMVKMKEGDFANAVPYLEMVLEDQPDHIPSLWYLTLSKLELGQYDQSERLFDQLEERLMSLKQVDQRIVHDNNAFHEAIRTTNSPDADGSLIPMQLHDFTSTDPSYFHRFIGLQYAEKDESVLAEKHITDALASYPEDPVLLHILSELAFERSEFRRVIELTNILLDGNPDDRSALGKQLLSYEYLNEIDKMAQTEKRIDELTN